MPMPRGFKHSEETKKKMREGQKRNPSSARFEKGHVPAHKGKKRPGVGGNPDWVKGCKPWDFGIHLSEETREKLREAHAGRHYSPETEFKKGHTIGLGVPRLNCRNEKIWSWKGDAVGKGPLHRWVATRKPKPECCELCGSKRKWLDLSNKDHTYKRKVEDYTWVCRPCHRKIDYARYGVPVKMRRAS